MGHDLHGAEHGNAGITGDGPRKRGEPILSRERIRVEGDDPVAPRLKGGEVVPGGKSEVLPGLNYAKPIIELRQRFDGAVGGTIVDDEGFEIFKRLSCECRDSARKIRAAIIIDDDNGKERDMQISFDPAALTSIALSDNSVRPRPIPQTYSNSCI